MKIEIYEEFAMFAKSYNFLFQQFFLESASRLQRPSAPPYVVKSLTQPKPPTQGEAPPVVHRTFWWEVLSMVKSQPDDLTVRVIKLLEDKRLKVCCNFAPFLFFWEEMSVFASKTV